MSVGFFRQHLGDVRKLATKPEAHAEQAPVDAPHPRAPNEAAEAPAPQPERRPAKPRRQ